MSRRPKIVLLGMLSKIPVGGVGWLVGHYATGFERLGYEVYYVEAHARTPSMFMEKEDDDATARAAAYIAATAKRFGLGDRWAFQALHENGRCLGMTSEALDRLYRDAALIVNMHGGTLPLPEHVATDRLVYLGTDPVQVELEVHDHDQRAIDFLDDHSAYFTWGLNYGNPDCTLPWASAFPMAPSPPPVVLDFWEAAAPAARAPLTTIGNWRQDYRDLEFEGRTLRWSKHHEFLKLIDLPGRVSLPLELALSSYQPADERLLTENGWRVRPGFELSRELDDYRAYIVASGGEFSVAKEQNVFFRSGWFSERSAMYLAAGRPVVMQDTGFGSALPTGEGLFAFDDTDGAAAAIETIASNPARHRRAAREIAREFLAHDVVLGQMLDHVGLTANGARRPRQQRQLPDLLTLRPLSRRPLRLDPRTAETTLMCSVPAYGGAGLRPDATVVIPVLDNLACVRMALESVLANSSDRALEIVVVDNGSDDPTREYLEVLAARNPSLRLIRNEQNAGFAAACNQGVSAASGPAVILLNSDTIVPPGWLERLLRHLDDPAVGIVTPTTNRCGGAAQVPTSYDTYGEMVAYADERAAAYGEQPLMDVEVAEMFCAAIRRDVWERVGPLDEQFAIGMFEDDDYSRRVRDAGLRVVCADDAFVHHFGEGSIGELAADGLYGELFSANRGRFEEKWATTWKPHERREDPAYSAVRARLRAAVLEHTRDGATVLVVSAGDDAFTDLPCRSGRHFPQAAGGGWAGHHPGGDDPAIAELERLREAGAGFLVIPAPSLWWLEHYKGLAEHLGRYSHVWSDPAVGVVYELTEVAAPKPKRRLGRRTRERETELLQRVQELEERLAAMETRDAPEPAADVEPEPEPELEPAPLLAAYLPPGARVAVLVQDDSDPGELDGWPTTPLSSRGGVLAVLARLEAARAQDYEFLLATPQMSVWLGAQPMLNDHVRGHYRAIVDDTELGLLTDLRSRTRAKSADEELLPSLAAVPGDAAVLDWTALDMARSLPGRNVFKPSGANGSLPYLDSTIDVALVDEEGHAAEAARVARDVLMVERRDDGLLSIVPMQRGSGDTETAFPVTVIAAGCDRRDLWLARLRESVEDVPGVAVIAGTDPRRALGRVRSDYVAIAERGVLPLPGCLEAAVELLGADDAVAAVAVKLISSGGRVAAAGVTVFADGSTAGIADDAGDLTAPWHEFVRPVCAGAGLVVFRTAAARAAAKGGTDLLAMQAAVWAAGTRIAYQPFSAAVRALDDGEPALDLPEVWSVALQERPPRPEVMDIQAWRTLIARDEPGVAWR